MGTTSIEDWTRVSEFWGCQNRDFNQPCYVGSLHRAYKDIYIIEPELESTTVIT